MEVRAIGSGPSSAASLSEKLVNASTVSAATPAKPTAAPVENTAQVQQPGSIPYSGQVKEAIENINKAVQTMAQDLEFSIDEDSDRTIVKIIDNQTKEVIRQVPSKEILEIAKALDKVQGLLIKQKA